MLTLRDADGTRMLTEDDLCEEIRLGEIDSSAEVRTPDRGFQALGESAYAPLFSETETIFARRLRAPTLPWLAIGTLLLGTIGLLTEPAVSALTLLETTGAAQWAAAMVSLSFLQWLVLLPTALVVARNERVLGAGTLLIPALLGAVPVGLWVAASSRFTTEGLGVLPVIGLLSAGLAASLRHRHHLPPLHRSRLNPWHLPLLGVLAAISPTDFEELRLAALAVTAGTAAVTALLWGARSLQPSWRVDALVAALLLLVPLPVSAIFQHSPALLGVGQVTSLPTAGVALWLPPYSSVELLEEPESWPHWEQTWRIKVQRDTAHLYLLGTIKDGFTTRFSPSDSPTVSPAMHAVMRSLSQTSEPYSVPANCDDTRYIACARAHYLSGDPVEALRQAERYIATNPSHGAAHALQARIWGEHPELAPDDAVEQTLLWMSEREARFSFVAVMGESLAPQHCDRAEAWVRERPSLSADVQQRFAYAMAPECGSWSIGVTP